MTETHRPEDEPNEILAAAREAKDHAAAAAKAVVERKNWSLDKKDLGRIGLGVGIGSAAVAAAVLFASRQRNDG